MKTTLDIPEALFRRAKSTAAQRGQTLKGLVTEALRAALGSGPASSSAEPPWMSGFGKLRRLHKETRRVQRRIDREFEEIEEEDRA